jgi:hypothetical protein
MIKNFLSNSQIKDELYCLSNNSELTKIICNYIEESNFIKKIFHRLVIFWKQKSISERRVLIKVTNHELTLRSNLTTAINNKQISYEDIKLIISPLKNLEERLSQEGNYWIGSSIIIPWLLAFFKDWTILAMGDKPVLQVICVFIVIGMALFLLTTGQKLKDFALNVKCVSTIIQDISDEADGSN